MELCTPQELLHFKLKLNHYLLSFDEHLRSRAIEDMALKAKIDTQTITQYRSRKKPIPKIRYEQMLFIIEHRPFNDRHKNVLTQRWV